MGDEEAPVVGDGEVVDTRIHRGEGAAGPAAQLDLGEVATRRLRSEQIPGGVEFHGGGCGEALEAALQAATLEVVAPDLSGDDLREPQCTIGAHREGVREREVVGEDSGLALAVGVELEQSAAGSEFVDEETPPVVAHRHSVGAGKVVAQGLVAAVGATRRDAGVHRLRGVEGAVVSKCAVVRSADALAQSRKGAVRTGVDIDGGDL